MCCLEHIPFTRDRDRPPATPPESDSDGSVHESSVPSYISKSCRLSAAAASSHPYYNTKIIATPPKSESDSDGSVHHRRFTGSFINAFATALYE
jgi:hypothetical protein